MTEEQIESTVQSWCNNLGIFEIYEELRYMPRDEQEALLTHAFNEWNHEPMLDLLKELAYHFGIYRLDKVVENWENTRMNNLTDLREQLQEDIIAYFCDATPLKVSQIHTDELCQIVVDRVTQLQDNLEDE